MIKINLLNSVTERNSGATVVVERKLANPMSRLLLMTGAVAALLAAVIAWDIISTQMAKTEAERQLAEQKQIAAELASVTKEMQDLEAKILNIDTRIETIKRLRASQAGPSAVLEAMRERILMVPGLYLEGIEQKGEQLTITGNSRDETQVTQFGRSLEFSSGLFSNLNIETVRKDAPNQPAAAPVAPGGTEAPKLEIVGFTIRCAYTPSKAAASQSQKSSPTSASNGQQQQQSAAAPAAAANSVANQPQTNPAPVSDGITSAVRTQVAKN